MRFPAPALVPAVAAVGIWVVTSQCARSELAIERGREGAERDAGGRDGGDAGAPPVDAGHDADAPDAPMPCTPSSPRVLAADADFKIGIDDAYVYYSSETSIRKTSKCGGAIETLVADSYTWGIVVRDGFVNYTGPGTLERIPTGGGAATVIHTSQFQPGYFAVDDSRMFFTEWLGNQEYLRAIALSGGSPTSFGEVDGALLAVDESHVYYASADEVARVPKTGGPTEVFAAIAEVARDIVVDESHVYWSDSADSMVAEVFRAPKSGGMVEVAYQGPGLPMGLAVDSSHLYFVDHVGGRVMRVHKANLVVDTIASDIPVLQDLAVDDDSVYVVSHALSEVHKLAK